MKNVKDSITKKKKMKHILCYFGLFFLIVLLFIPMIFRIVFKDRKDESKVDVVSRLECKRGDESLISSFLNDKPQKIKYTILGNYMISSDSNMGDENNTNQQEPENDIDQTNPVLKRILNYANFVYDEETNTSVINFDVVTASGTADYESIFSTISAQETFFQTNGFTCTKTSLS